MTEILLLTGHMCGPAVWAPQAEALVDKGHGVQCPGLPLRDTIRDTAADLLAATAAPSFLLAGFSYGGYVALEMIRQAPQRVAGLALVATSARPDKPENADRRRANITRVENGEGRRVADEFIEALFPPARRDARRALIAAEVGEMMRARVDAQFACQQQAHITRPDARTHIGGFGFKTLVMCGTEDQVTPPELAEEIAALVRGARLVLVADAGHVVTLEQPATVSEEMASWAAA